MKKILVIFILVGLSFLSTMRPKPVFAQTALPSACQGIVFTRILRSGMTGKDVMCLQALLNQSPDTQLAPIGPGSPGEETLRFGYLTRVAVTAFQQKYATEILTPLGFTKGTGIVGILTIAKLDSILASNSASAQPATSDINPPIISNVSKTNGAVFPAGTTQAMISLNATDLTEPVNCKYNINTDVAYALMSSIMQNTGGSAYSATITGLSDGNSYVVYVRCIDSAHSPNENNPGIKISFSVE